MVSEPGLAHERPTRLALIFRVRKRLCALPLASVVETMRLLPVRLQDGTPPFVTGISTIRGVPVPVVDSGSLLDGRESPPKRLIALKIADRRVALAVDEVLGIRELSAESMQDLPPLLKEAGDDVIEAIGTFDAELLLVLRDIRIVPDSVWTSVGSQDVSR
jgi:purine-binding chemotaxis protein CheW